MLLASFQRLDVGMHKLEEIGEYLLQETALHLDLYH